VLTACEEEQCSWLASPSFADCFFYSDWNQAAGKSRCEAILDVVDSEMRAAGVSFQKSQQACSWDSVKLSARLCESIAWPIFWGHNLSREMG